MSLPESTPRTIFRLQRQQMGIKMPNDFREEVYAVAPHIRLYGYDAAVSVVGRGTFKDMTENSPEIKKRMSDPVRFASWLLSQSLEESRRVVVVRPTDLRYKPKRNGRAQKIQLDVHEARNTDILGREQIHYVRLLEKIGNVALDPQPQDNAITLGEVLNEEATDKVLSMVATRIPQHIGLDRVRYRIFE